MKKILKLSLIVMLCFTICACGSDESGSESGNVNDGVNWDDYEITNNYPKPELLEGELDFNNESGLAFRLKDYTVEDYNNYSQMCIDAGFTVDTYGSEGYHFLSFNEDGYKIRTVYLHDEQTMLITMTKPLEMSDITWPTTDKGSILPAPETNTGKLVYNLEDKFAIYIGDTTTEDLKAYVSLCESKGFEITLNDARIYRLSDEDGNDITLEYLGNNIVDIYIYE